MSLIRRLFKDLRLRLVFGVVIIVCPLLLLLIFSNIYSMQVVRTQVAQSNKYLISLYMRIMDQKLEEVDRYLISLFLEDNYLLKFGRDSQDSRFARFQLLSKLKTDINYYPVIDGFFAYSVVNDDWITTSLSDINDMPLLGSIEELVIRSSSEVQAWQVANISGENYLYHSYKSSDVYVGAWMKADKLLVTPQLVDLGQNGFALLATDAFEPITHRELVAEQNIDLHYDDGPYVLTGGDRKYLVIGEKSEKGEFSLIAVIPDSIVLEKLPFLQRIITLIAIGCVFVLIFYSLFLRRVLLNPIKRIITAMRKIKEGRWDTRIQPTPTSFQFEIMNDTFNHMISQIQELTINVYEEKIQSQKMELQNLKLQINPHFFLNSLNIINNLTLVKDYKLIQEMTRCLIQYFRFMFRNNTDFVSLGDEVNHTVNYLRIQQLRFPDHLTYEIHVPDGLKNALVPPLILQSFAENTIKHAMTLDEPVAVNIRVESIKTGSEPRLRMTVSDSGPGFPPDVLRRLNDGLEIGSPQGERVGIFNVIRRLKILYQDKAAIVFSNGAHGGAVVQMTLPWIGIARNGGEME